MHFLSYKINNVFFPAVLYITLIQLPTSILLFIFRLVEISNQYNSILTPIIDFFIAATLTIVFFLFVSILLPRILFNIVVIISYMLAGAFLYFVVNFRKLYNADVLRNIFNVGLELVNEFLSIQLFIILFITFIIGIICLKVKSVRSIKISKIVSGVFIGIWAVLLPVDFTKSKFSQSSIVINTYMPFSIISETIKYYNSYSSFLKMKEAKKDVTKLYNYKFVNKNAEPLVIVMILGESMRGDLIGLNNVNYDNMPNLTKIKNLISFSKATSSATSTTESVPYMLTRAIPPNWNEAISENSVISIFKSLGFETVWLSSQTMAGVYELDYTPIILESDTIFSRNDIRKYIGDTLVRDGDLLPILSNILKNNENKNLFIVLQMIGSHWSFAKRYTVDFEKYKPSCSANSPINCSDKEIFNGYNNTILYSDYVLSEVIKLLENKQSFVFFSSDHGYSLREDGLFGNSDSRIPPTPYQTNIAMFMWGADKYRKNYGDAFLKYNKRSKPVSHNNIFHSLLDCANVRSEVIDHSLSLCHNSK